MHLMFLTRGHAREVEEWAKFMQTIPFNFPVFDEIEGKTKTNIVWGALRPIQLWEFVFPEKHMIGNMQVDSLDFVMNTLRLTQEHSHFQKSYKNLDKFLFPIRKALKLEKIPEIKKTPTYPFPEKWVHVVPIGWKLDEMGSVNESPHLKHEKL